MTTYTTKQEALDYIAQLEALEYHLSHGEYARPVYAARKARGEDAYYIHANYYYYEGTLNRPKNGAL